MPSAIAEKRLAARAARRRSLQLRWPCARRLGQREVLLDVGEVMLGLVEACAPAQRTVTVFGVTGLHVNWRVS